MFGEPGRDIIMGQTGIKGRKGTKGERGSLGPDGLPGQDGQDGVMGPFGAKGSPGEIGAEGWKVNVAFPFLRFKQYLLRDPKVKKVKLEVENLVGKDHQENQDYQEYMGHLE